MKLVKEHINFERGIDPKKSMGIGIEHFVDYFLDWLEKEKFPYTEDDCGPFISLYKDKDGFLFSYFDNHESEEEKEKIWKGFEYFMFTWPSYKNKLKKKHIKIWSLDNIQPEVNFQMTQKHWKELKKEAW